MTAIVTLASDPGALGAAVLLGVCTLACLVRLVR